MFLIFLDLLTTINEIIVLATGFAGLISAGVAAYAAVKSWLKQVKQKEADEIWSMIVIAADAAIVQVEESLSNGETKKEMAINIVKETLAANGLDISEFLDRLSVYIDDTITFVNKMKNVVQTELKEIEENTEEEKTEEVVNE